MLKLFAHSQKGQSVAFFVLLLPLLLIMPVLVLELGHLYIYKAELQHAADIGGDAAIRAKANNMSDSDIKGLVLTLAKMNANRIPEAFRDTIEVTQVTTTADGSSTEGKPERKNEFNTSPEENDKYDLEKNPPVTSYSYPSSDNVTDPPSNILDENQTGLTRLTYGQYQSIKNKYFSRDEQNEIENTFGLFNSNNTRISLYTMTVTKTTTTLGTREEEATITTTGSGSSTVVLTEAVQPIFVGIFDKEDTFQNIKVGAQNGDSNSSVSTSKDTTIITDIKKTETTTSTYYYLYKVVGSHTEYLDLILFEFPYTVNDYGYKQIKSIEVSKDNPRVEEVTGN